MPSHRFAHLVFSLVSLLKVWVSCACKAAPKWISIMGLGFAFPKQRVFRTIQCLQESNLNRKQRHFQLFQTRPKLQSFCLLTFCRKGPSGRWHLCCKASCLGGTHSRSVSLTPWTPKWVPDLENHWHVSNFPNARHLLHAPLNMYLEKGASAEKKSDPLNPPLLNRLFEWVVIQREWKKSVV